jgi:HK97 family phage major capsid protein/HK97 family phage prohead protease
MLKRAYAQFVFKAAADAGDGKRRFTGIASTIATDRMDDIVVPSGAKFKLPLPLLWQHNSREPIGWVTAARVKGNEIEVDCEVHNETTPGKLKDRLDEVWQMLAAGMVRGLSIGFNPKEYSRIEGSYGLKYLEWEWLELSAVTIAANQEASITAIKSVVKAQRAALGQNAGEDDEGDDFPGASGARTAAHRGFSLKPKPKKGPEMNIAEQLKALREARAQKAAKMQAIMEKSVEEGRSTNAEEAAEFDELEADVKTADADIERLERLEKMNVQRAVPAATERGRGTSIEVGNILSVRRNMPKGTAFTRFVMAVARGKGSNLEALNVAEHLSQKSGPWCDTPEVVEALKAASAAGSTTDSTFAASLVYAQNLSNEFIELLRPMTILGKFGTNGIPSLRRVPFNVRMVSQTGGGTYGWVGEGAPKPVGELTLTDVTLRWAKAAGIIVITDELSKFSTPDAEAVVRQDMLNGMATFSDVQFISPQIAAVANVSPASITNGVTDVPATGTTADALRDDINTLLGRMYTANLAPTSGVWIMSNRMATSISLMRNSLGQKEYPDMTPLGGILEGFPVIASESVPDDSAGGMIVFVNAQDIFFSDDGPVTIDVSREASLQMDTAPSDPTTAATVMINLWQRNLVGLRAERYMNWAKRRTAAVQYISSAAYN